MNAPLRYLHLPPEAPLPPHPFSQPFRAVVAAEVMVSPDWMSTVSEWLVDGGCLFAMAWGLQGTDWDTAIDEANLEKHEFGEIPENRFVMTSWHDDESLGEVFWFCKNLAHHPSVDLRATLILHISPVPDEPAYRQSYDAA